MRRRTAYTEGRATKPIERFQNTQMKFILEARRWERHNGQLMRYHKYKWHPVTREDEEELREILHTIVDRIDWLLAVVFGEEEC